MYVIVKPTEERAQIKPIRRLTCCCCGESTRGRQWWNRDNGFGVCNNCVTRQLERGETAENIESYYGIKGTHYTIQDGLE